MRTPRSTTPRGFTPNSRSSAAAERLTRSAARLEEEMRQLTGLIDVDDARSGVWEQSESQRLEAMRASAQELEEDNGRLKRQVEALKRMLRSQLGGRADEAADVEVRLAEVRVALSENSRELERSACARKHAAAVGPGAPPRGSPSASPPLAYRGSLGSPGSPGGGGDAGWGPGERPSAGGLHRSPASDAAACHGGTGTGAGAGGSTAAAAGSRRDEPSSGAIDGYFLGGGFGGAAARRGGGLPY